MVEPTPKHASSKMQFVVQLPPMMESEFVRALRSCSIYSQQANYQPSMRSLIASMDALINR